MKKRRGRRGRELVWKGGFARVAIGLSWCGSQESTIGLRSGRGPLRDRTERRDVYFGC